MLSPPTATCTGGIRVIHARVLYYVNTKQREGVSTPSKRNYVHPFKHLTITVDFSTT